LGPAIRRPKTGVDPLACDQALCHRLTGFRSPDERMSGCVAAHISPQWTFQVAGSELSVTLILLVIPGNQLLIYPVL
jgi:hypothetical protein